MSFVGGVIGQAPGDTADIIRGLTAEIFAGRDGNRQHRRLAAVSRQVSGHLLRRRILWQLLRAAG